MKPYKTILSIALTFLVLFSSNSFMIGIHMCAGEFRNAMLFTDGDDFEIERKIPPDNHQQTTPCCQDDSRAPRLDLIRIAVAAAIIRDIAQPAILSEVIPSTIISDQYFNYNPPLRSFDLTIVHRVFLI